MSKIRKALEVGLIMLAWSLSTQVAHGDVLQLARDGRSEYRVVIAEDAEEPIPAAAQEFVHFFEEITGAQLPIVTAAEPMGEREIIIGPSKHLDNLATYIDWEKLGREGYVIRTVGDYLLLFGGPGRGTINAVYTLLDEYLGCRWYTSTFSVIPKNPDLSIDLIHVEKVPAFEARAISSSHNGDPAWTARQRINSFNASIRWAVLPCDFAAVQKVLADPRLAKCLKFACSKSFQPGYWLHTLRAGSELLPLEHFEEYPEYFGMNGDGKRDPDITLCLTNPAVLPIVVENARKWLEHTPGANIISVSQSDKPQYDYCHCPMCQEAWKKFSYKLNKNPLGRFPYGTLPGWVGAEGQKRVRPVWNPSSVGPAGVLLEFVNRVAEELEEDYPNVLVHTLAYFWTKYPPEEIELHPNVVIDFAPYNSCNRHPLADCAYNEQFKGLWTALRRWRKLTPHIWVWRYDHRGPDKPTLRYLDLQMREFEMAGIGGVYMFTYEFEAWNWMRDLRAYLFAKLLWDPCYDMRKGMAEFVRAYYGAAAEPILTYVLDTQEADNYDAAKMDSDIARISAFRFHGRDLPVRSAAVRRWDKLFETAEAQVADDAVCLERVKIARLAVQRGALEYLPEDDPVRVKAYRDIFPIAEKAGMNTKEIREKYGPKK